MQFGSDVKSLWSIALDFKVTCKSKAEFQQIYETEAPAISVSEQRIKKKIKFINKLCCFLSYQVPCLFYLA